MAEKGMIVDVAIHPPDAKSDDRNVHMHMLLTMREITPDGFGNKVREWNRETELQQWKERWSELGAHHLERAGFEREAERFRVGHLTLEKQREAAFKRGDYAHANELDREPAKHMGPHATAMERRGVETRKGDLNQDIAERNRRKQNERDLRDARTLDQYQHERRMPIRETPRQVWEAFQNSIDPRDFKADLENRGLYLARITEDDHRNSHTYRFVAERQGKFSALLFYGEYVAVNEFGHAYQLNSKTTGMEAHRVKEFMKPLDSDKTIPALYEIRRKLESERGLPDPRPTGWMGESYPGHLAQGVTRVAERAAGKVLEAAADAIESLFAPRLTPEQRREAEIVQQERRHLENLASQERRAYDRER
jgi:hypothetical protein